MIRWKLEIMRLRLKCFLVGHDERTGGEGPPPYEDDRCYRCFVTWPTDRIDLPTLLSRLYGWFVERDWRWFDRLDMWLCENYSARLPNWWSY